MFATSRRRLRQRARILAALAVWSVVLGTIAVVPAAPRASALSGPVARWNFDESSGTTAHDAASTHDGALLGGATWDPTGGHDGSGALNFDGSGDGVQIPTAGALEPGSITISLWMKTVDHGSDLGFETLIQKGANDCEAGSYGLQAQQEGTSIGARARSRWDQAGSGYWGQWDSPTARLWDDQWHHIAWTFDSVSGGAGFYIDGISVGSVGAPLQYSLPTASDLFLGVEPVDCPNASDFHGSLDDVRVYGRALAPSEIEALNPARPTTVQLAMDASTFSWAGLPTGTVTVSPVPTVSVPVVVYDVTNGAHTFAASGNTNPFLGTAEISVRPGNDGFDLGTHQIAVEFEGAGSYQPSTSDPTDLTIVKVPNSIALGTASLSVTPNGSTTLTASLSRYTDTAVTFVEQLGGGGTATLGTVDLSYNGHYFATIDTGPLAVGDHVFSASIDETSHFASAESNPITIHVAIVGTSTSVDVFGDLQTHHPQTIAASVNLTSPIASPPPVTGTLTFRDGATTLGATDISASNQLVMPSMAIGPHSLTVEYSGDAFYGGSTSEPQVISITPDVVEATGVGLEFGTFYPVVDKYRDVNHIKGTRTEPLSVGIVIYNSSNNVVRRATIARAGGAYTYAWNGRTSTGSILAAGRYRIVQTLTDAYGTKKAFTSYTTLSAKKLVNHTTYVTKRGDLVSAKGTGGTGRLYVSSSGGYAKLVSGADGFVVAGWQLTLPSAAVYRSLSFQVYGKAHTSIPMTQIAVQNFVTCGLSSSWYESCFDHWHWMGTAAASLVWTSTSAHANFNRSGRSVRGMIDVPYGTAYVYRVRFKVTYATLQ